MIQKLALKIDNLFVNYRNTQNTLPVLSNINLKVKKGEFISIIGPSGCGKTTLLYTIAGLKERQRGKISSSVDTAIVFQDPLLLPWRNVLGNISYGAEMLGLDREESLGKSNNLIELVHLGGFKNYFPHQLSGGMKQRVNIARALCVDPGILLLDEPFSNLDSQIREIMQQELLDIYAKTRKTFILVTHNVEEAVFLSDRVIVLSKRPARIKKEIKVDLKRPRNISMKDGSPFISIKKTIMEAIKDEIQV